MSEPVYVAKVVAELRSQLLARADWIGRELPGLIDTCKNLLAASDARYRSGRDGARRRRGVTIVSGPTCLSEKPCVHSGPGGG